MYINDLRIKIVEILTKSFFRSNTCVFAPIKLHFIYLFLRFARKKPCKFSGLYTFISHTKPPRKKKEKEKLKSQRDYRAVAHVNSKL